MEEELKDWRQQMGEVVELRDMINWCVDNTLDGEELALDSAEMLQLEAYINWDRRGVALEPGKH
ncbi:hypothetical protein [Thiohalorhabdus denitrificans]|uniref:hypothetical protein n=1 Tax=Thiohalorhabdus denitrificans TaxID=381306 RepID=UPI0006D53B26|nr:hypothetical protein [Thiohalorhabdus denitrificans]